MAISENLLRTALSADSHVVEPPGCYIDHIDPKFRDRAPFIVRDANGGDAFQIDGLPGRLPIGMIAAAGVDSSKVKLAGVPFEEVHRGGWDPKARIADQDRDGVKGEVIYPSVGMLLCSHKDPDYKQACMWAYNRWLAEEFCAGAPDRLFGLGQTAVRSVKEAIEDLQRFKEMGFRGVMLPGEPATEEAYHDKSFDPLWRASVELDMPISFHILTTNSENPKLLEEFAVKKDETKAVRSFIRGHRLVNHIKEIVLQFIWGQVFERHPKLKLVLVEADAGWAPHFMFRMDHVYDRHRYAHGGANLPRKPSDYFMENVYLTFQDDRIAFATAHLMNPKRLLWANDFPHTDASWPWSQDILREQTKNLSEADTMRIIRDNTAELYGIPTH